MFAAEKYGLEGLKAACGVKLSERVDSRNVLLLLDASEKVNESTLKTACMSFLARHVKSILPTEEWKQFRSAQPNLVDEIIAAAL